MKLVNWGHSVPLTVHLLVTSRCNLNCPRCFYRGDGEIPFETALKLLDEWRGLGVRSIAIGGGEPLLYPDIEALTWEAKRRGFYVALTTNGTVKKRVFADRVHVSFDEIHQTSFADAAGAVRFFRKFVPKVGVNHIVTGMAPLRLALRLASELNVSTFTLLMEKPKSSFTDWGEAIGESSKLVGREKLWVDACLAQKLGLRRCRQGVTSMSLNQKLEASRCSNIREKVAYTCLPDAWRKIQAQRCLFRIWAMPLGVR